MPGPYIHQSVMRHVASRLAYGFKPVQSSLGMDKGFLDPDTSGYDLSQAPQLIDKYPNYACLGAIGPDLFQFLPDFPKAPFLAYVVQYLKAFYDALDPYIESWDAFAGPIGENTSEFFSRTTGGLSESFSTLFSELIDFLVTKVENLVVSSRDWIGYFSLEMNTGCDEQAFTWMDMLHYRSTSRFGRELWMQASSFNDGYPNEALQAYALGYITHLGTDITGHPFVNAVTGGPYREHWHRHHLVEVQSDAFWYLADQLPGAPKGIEGYSEYPESALYFDISFNEDGSPIPRPLPPGGGTLREEYNRKKALDKDSELPDDLAQLLHDALKSVYCAEGATYPHVLPNGEDGLPTTDHIKDAFDLLYSYLKLSTCDSFDHERPEVPEVWGNLDPPMIPSVDLPPGLTDTEYDILDFAFSLLAILYYIGTFVVWLVTLPVAVVADVATYGIRILLYYVELALYQVVKDARAFLVLMGFLAPTHDEIASGLIQVGTTRAESYSAVRSEMGDVFGGMSAPPPVQEQLPFNDESSPHVHEKADAWTSSLEYTHPWSYPQTPAELGTTFMSPYPKGADPSVLFNGRATDPNFRDRIIGLAYSPADTDDINKNYLTTTTHLGDAPNFSMYLAWLCTRDESLNLESCFVDFNLDGDHGYAYKCWDWKRTTAQSTDPLGHKFNNPVTWPSQTDPSQGVFDPTADLQMEYLPRVVQPVIK